MTDPVREINESRAIDRPYLPDYEESSPRALHESHEWIEVSDRWRECSRCGARDHWPAAGLKCGRPTNGRTKVDEIKAWNALITDLEKFFVWWASRPDTPSTLPSVDEWSANFFEWRKSK